MELTNLDVSNDHSLAEGKIGPLSDGEDESSSSRGPPSETSSQEWVKVTD